MQWGVHFFEDNIPVGNWENKYQSNNPIYRRLCSNFITTIRETVSPIAHDVSTITEVGCGEGFLSAEIASWNIAPVKAFDLSAKIIRVARELHGNKGIHFYVRSIYEATPEEDGADLVFCCEVLEHLEDPDLALDRLSRIANRYVLISVPNEPLWRILNVCRGKYLKDLGNTPGHINHWSASDIKYLVSEYFNVRDFRFALPWTILLGEKISLTYPLTLSSRR